MMPVTSLSAFQAVHMISQALYGLCCSYGKNGYWQWVPLKHLHVICPEGNKLM